ncbi:MAG: hypothetical protein IPI03_17825 [Rubrivivax sp.]|nr:hypothetical protein [Rubrivivax sp.]MBK8526874.1 hypothetical protein [Rubrivivax sp.]
MLARVAIPAASAAKPRMGHNATFAAAVGAALRADGRLALAQLNATNAADLCARDRQLWACMLERLAMPFVPHTAALTAAPRALLSAYQAYWHRHLTQAPPLADNETLLLADVNAVLATERQEAAATLSASEPALKSIFMSQGLHALLGRTSPLLELMLWSTEETQRYPVLLAESRVDVSVVFLHGFASLGWAGYATCNRHHSGGWATDDALYAVSQAYDRASENFRVSYLVHEGQHVSDYRRFPGLPQSVLEYRAKLAELCAATETIGSLLHRFGANTSVNPDLPHAFANRLVIDNLSASLGIERSALPDWRSFTPGQVNEAARTLLQRDSDGRVAVADRP